MKLLGKIKIHELAKKLNMNSKEIIEKANELGINVKSHLSSIEEEQAEKIEKALKGSNVPVKKNKKENADNNKKDSKPVIIRREVIITDDEEEKKEEEKKKNEQKKQEVGFVDKNRKTDFNIVYRNKQTKPLTVDELFGRKKEEKKIEPIIEERQEVKTTKTMTNKEIRVEDKTVVEMDKKVEKTENVVETKKQVEPVKSNTEKQGQQYNNNQRHNNNQNNYRNGGYNNGNYNNNNRQRNNNYQKNGEQNNNSNSQNNNHPRNNNYNNQNRNNNYQRNNNQNSGNYNNRPRNNNYNNGRKPLDSIGIEKNIKNIMATEQIEKESVREYQNKAIDKQKINRYDEPKKKQTKSRREENFDMKKGKLKDLKQVDKLSHLFNEGEMLDYYDLTTERGRKNKRNLVKTIKKTVNKKSLN